jgi:uncharacterized OsmC-like protein
MKITLEEPTRLRVENAPGPLTVEAPGYERLYEPFDMLASALGVCTHAVLTSWAQQAKLDADSLVVRISWTVDDDHRMSKVDVRFDWPGLPADRVKAAERAASLCSIHKTLTHPPTITVGTPS